mmetsp:Transcript_10189/g.15366  ORF Transcript_10189/g.15366 Transcript_10189/m.15366 type:complete len:84 (+) Transcript_10189:3-254(+)
MEVISGKITYYLPPAKQYIVNPKAFKGKGINIHTSIRDQVPFVVGKGEMKDEKRYLEVKITAEMRNQELLAVPSDILLTSTTS